MTDTTAESAEAPRTPERVAVAVGFMSPAECVRRIKAASDEEAAEMLHTLERAALAERDKQWREAIVAAVEAAGDAAAKALRSGVLDRLMDPVAEPAPTRCPKCGVVDGPNEAHGHAREPK